VLLRSGADVIAFTGSSDTAARIRKHPNILAQGVLVNVEADSVNAALLSPDAAPGQPAFDAYLIRRRDYFMGKMLRFSGVNPWHLRLFRSGLGRCESRLYDQHFISSAKPGRLDGFMHDKNSARLADWIASHNRWSDAEAKEKLGPRGAGDNVLQPRLMGDARERTRFIKELYYKLPTGIRSLGYFIYRYIFRLGFLDGTTGFYFAFFQALWFRMLVDAKMYEQRHQHPSN